DVDLDCLGPPRDGLAEHQSIAHEAVVAGALLLELSFNPFARLIQRSSAERFVKIAGHPIELALSMIAIGQNQAILHRSASRDEYREDFLLTYADEVDSL